MWTLLMRLAAPLQSWGGVSKFENRRTELSPTKSAVIGLISSALGRRRDEDISDLSKMRFGVRDDYPGTVIRDFHTVQTGKTSVVSNRFYLSDAIFLAGIEADSLDQLESIKHALQNPKYPLFLGRRSCPPELPVFLEIVNCSLEQALTQHPLLKRKTVDKYSVKKEQPLLLHLEAPFSIEGSLVRDNPKSFNPEKREFYFRNVITKVIDDPDGSSAKSFGENTSSPEHDFYKELEI